MYQRQFSRPVEYDPSLAERTASTMTRTREDAMRDELGLASDSSNDEDDHPKRRSDDDEDDDAANGSRRKQAKKKQLSRNSSNNNDFADDDAQDDAFHSASDDDDFQNTDSQDRKKKKKKKSRRYDSEQEEENEAEINHLTELLAEANEAKMKAEQRSVKLESRIEELRAVSEKAKLIMKEKFRQQMKSYLQQIQEQKEMLEDDEERLNELQEKVTLAETNGDQEQTTIKMREYRDGRQLSRENISLRYKMDELAQHLRTAKDEADDLRKQVVEARAQIVASSAQELEQLTEKVTTLESEKHTLREELKKRFIERARLLAKIGKLQERLGDAIPLDDIQDEAHPNNTHSQQEERDKASKQLDMLQHKQELDKLKHEIKQLKEALRTATRPIVQAPALTPATVSAASLTLTPSPSPQPPGGPSSSAATASAGSAFAAPSQPAASPTLTSAPIVAASTPSPTPPSSSASSSSSGPASKETQMELEKVRKEKTELEEMLRKTDALMKRREEEMNIVKNKAKEKLVTASTAITKLKEEYNKLRDQYNRARHSSSGVEAELRNRVQQSISRRKRGLQHVTSTVSLLKQELASVRSQVSKFEANLFATLSPMLAEAMQKYSEQGAAALTEIKDKYVKEMKLRKQLFNQIQELKGNIRVYCRVRPMQERERNMEGGEECVSFPSPEELAIVNPEKKQSHQFEFEKIFQPRGVTQESVFSEIAELVTSVLDGYNVCIFAYGQTGSGKTFTMQGPADNPGVNVRALAMLFQEARARYPDIEYEISVSLLEIYNEQIKDLLGDPTKRLKCVQGKEGQEVPELTIRSVSTKEEVLEQLAIGSKNRHVTATNMNDYSSRSHLILSVYVSARNNLTNKETRAKLHLIDLAGSERVGRSGVEGEALKEAQNINTSLSALGNCIHARANKADHVPYRDSSLTWLLKDSLEKNSKTLMFVQISPLLKDASESVCSLKFAARVREVELGKASKNEKKSSSASSK